MSHQCLCKAGLALLLFALPLQAQEPAFMEAATHPGRGTFYTRALASYAAYKMDGESVDDYTLSSKSAYGLHPRLALLLDIDIRNIQDKATCTTGLDHATMRLKYRYLQLDLSPINTIRASATAGIILPGDRDINPNRNAAPRVGSAITAILGRHGLNAQIDRKFLPDTSDETQINASHLYRIAPARYTRDTTGAWYTMLESLNTIMDNRDYRSDIAIGILYEARRWAAEAAVRLPLSEKGPRESDAEAIIGYRHLF